MQFPAQGKALPDEISLYCADNAGNRSARLKIPRFFLVIAKKYQENIKNQSIIAVRIGANAIR
jgi:hypothetical protein